MTMVKQQKILLLDDDQQMLDLYQELLKQLPSKPEVHVSNAGTRAIAMLESEPFNLLITDLRMPKMDGLQVLAIVRRKFPDLRIVVLTGVVDEEYRSRAYAQGVESFWQKPTNTEEMELFQDCIESLLDRETRRRRTGFRGMQSKSLVDLIQLECLSRSSSVLHVTHGALDGKIWVQNGEIIDASHGAFHRRRGLPAKSCRGRAAISKFCPPIPEHIRTITNSYQGLLLDSAQALDEWRGQQAGAEPPSGATDNPAPSGSALAPLARFEGVEFVLTVPVDEQAAVRLVGLGQCQGTCGLGARDPAAAGGIGREAGSRTADPSFGLWLAAALGNGARRTKRVALRRLPADAPRGHGGPNHETCLYQMGLLNYSTRRRSRK